jgi:hypothetical protein
MTAATTSIQVAIKGLGTIMPTLGTVTSKEISKDAGLFQLPMPQSNSSAAILLDLFGASKTITINGKYTNLQYGAVTVQVFIFYLESLVNGSQTAAKYISEKSDLEGYAGINVLIQAVSWKAEAGNPNSVEYTISMIEGSI